jgi:catechol 2,3-dioxygenase-like lactoylglutathione lyase family enzyme
MEELEMRIGVTEVFVDDQEKARTFYTGLLGFQVKVDASYSDTARWLTVVSPEDPNGTELLLTPINDAAAVLQRFPAIRAHPRSRSPPKAAGSPTGSCPTEGPCSSPSPHRWVTAAPMPSWRTDAATS